MKKKSLIQALSFTLLASASFFSFAQTTITTSPYGNSLSFGTPTYGVPAYGYPQQPVAPVAPPTETTSNQDKLADLAKKLDESKQKHTDTASEQGYVDANAALKQSAQEEDYRQDHTPRQLGYVVSQYGPGKTVSNTASLSLWLENWTYVLKQYGIPSTKVNFEARRLSEGEFKTWANNQILASTGQKTNQQEYVNDPQPHDGNAIPRYTSYP